MIESFDDARRFVPLEVEEQGLAELLYDGWIEISGVAEDGEELMFRATFKTAMLMRVVVLMGLLDVHA